MTTPLARLYQRTNTGNINSFFKNVCIHLQLTVPLFYRFEIINPIKQLATFITEKQSKNNEYFKAVKS